MRPIALALCLAGLIAGGGAVAGAPAGSWPAQAPDRRMVVFETFNQPG